MPRMNFHFKEKKGAVTTIDSKRIAANAAAAAAVSAAANKNRPKDALMNVSLMIQNIAKQVYGELKDPKMAKQRLTAAAAKNTINNLQLFKTNKSFALSLTNADLATIDELIAVLTPIANGAVSPGAPSDNDIPPYNVDSNWKAFMYPDQLAGFSNDADVNAKVDKRNELDAQSKGRLLAKAKAHQQSKPMTWKGWFLVVFAGVMATLLFAFVVLVVTDSAITTKVVAWFRSRFHFAGSAVRRQFHPPLHPI